VRSTTGGFSDGRQGARGVLITTSSLDNLVGREGKGVQSGSDRKSFVGRRVGIEKDHIWSGKLEQILCGGSTDWGRKIGPATQDEKPFTSKKPQNQDGLNHLIYVPGERAEPQSQENMGNKDGAGEGKDRPSPSGAQVKLQGGGQRREEGLFNQKKRVNI